jgi:hypothetical protein
MTITTTEVADELTVRGRLADTAGRHGLPPLLAVTVPRADHLVLVVEAAAHMVAWTEHLCGDWRAEARLDAGRLRVRVHGECRLLGWAVSVVPTTEPVEVTP